jgi:hypothetical protein
LDSLLEESRKRTAEAAKYRQPLSDGSVTGGKKRKSSPSSRNSSSMQAEEPYWKWDPTYNRYFHLDLEGNITWAEEVQSPSAQ